MLTAVESAAVDHPELARRVLERLHERSRFILGVTGPPGTGKSTFVAGLCRALLPRQAVVVPMDGFHLGNAVLRATMLEHRKGAIDTFDSAGYALMMHRLRMRDEEVVYAPDYQRSIEEPVAASIAVPRHIQIVITEGNYLLSGQPDWVRARAAMDEVWYLETPADLRLGRLTGRHVAFGRSPDEATRWATGTDETNARAVAATREHADLIVHAG